MRTTIIISSWMLLAALFATLLPDGEAVGFVDGRGSNLQVHLQGLDNGREMVRAIHSATSFLFVRPRETR